MIDQWIKEIKKREDADEIGMILSHNGIVRGSSKFGDRPIKHLKLSYNEELADRLVKEYETKDGIHSIKLWLNQGKLKIGDDIMYFLVAGRYRSDVIPVFEDLLSRIKNEVVTEEEIE